MVISNKIIEEYVESIKPKYDTEVFNIMLSNIYDKELVEESVLKLYVPKNNGVKPKITWLNNPLEMTKLYPGKKIDLFSSYFNINWVYFYKTFLQVLDDKNLKSKYEYYDFEKNKNVLYESELIYNIFSNTFGVGEVSGREVKYEEILLVKKPDNVSVLEDKLHSIKGPSFTYDNTNLRFYYIEGIKFEEDMWVRLIKTGLNNPGSPINDQLNGFEIKKLKSYIKQIEKNIGKQNELTIKDILMIDNLEEKSKVIRYVGLNKIIQHSNLIGEESVTTHKGEIIKYQLFEIDLGLELDKIPSRFVKVVCWSTNKDYVLQVDPRNRQCETPIGAIAWTCIKPDGNHCTIDEYLQLKIQT